MAGWWIRRVDDEMINLGFYKPHCCSSFHLAHFPLCYAGQLHDSLEHYIYNLELCTVAAYSVLKMPSTTRYAFLGIPVMTPKLDRRCFLETLKIRII